MAYPILVDTFSRSASLPPSFRVLVLFSFRYLSQGWIDFTWANSMASAHTLNKLNRPRRRITRDGDRDTDLESISAPEQSPQCYVIGIDYGATFSAVTYTLVNHDSFLKKTLPRLQPSRIKTLQNYPDQTFSDQGVPTSLVYRIPPDDIAADPKRPEGPSAWGLRSESVRGLG